MYTGLQKRHLYTWCDVPACSTPTNLDFVGLLSVCWLLTACTLKPQRKLTSRTLFVHWQPNENLHGVHCVYTDNPTQTYISYTDNPSKTYIAYTVCTLTTQHKLTPRTLFVHWQPNTNLYLVLWQPTKNLHLFDTVCTLTTHRKLTSLRHCWFKVDSHIHTRNLYVYTKDSWHIYVQNRLICTQKRHTKEGRVWAYLHRAYYRVAMISRLL